MSDKICIGVPSGEMVHARYMLCLLNMIKYCGDMHIDSINYRSSRIAANRNEIVKAAKGFGSTHLLYTDADMTFPPEALQILLQHDKDIVCATATKREEGPNDPIGTPESSDEAVTNRRLIKMRFVGMPFMLIKMSVFDKLQWPYFCEPIVDGEIVPEDDYFCRTVRAAGYDIWCDLHLSMQIGHLGTKEFKIAPVKEPQLQIVKVA